MIPSATRLRFLKWLLLSSALFFWGCGALLASGAGHGEGTAADVSEGLAGRGIAVQAFPGDAIALQFWFPAGPVTLDGTLVAPQVLRQLRSGEEQLLSALTRLGVVARLSTEPSAVVLSILLSAESLDAVLDRLAGLRLSESLDLRSSPTPRPQRERLNRLMNLSYQGSAMGFGLAAGPLRTEQLQALGDAFRFSNASVVAIGPPRLLPSIQRRIQERLGPMRMGGFPGFEVRAAEQRVVVERGKNSEAFITIAIPIRIATAKSSAQADGLIRVLARGLNSRLMARRQGRVRGAFLYSPGIDSRLILELELSSSDPKEAWATLSDGLVDLREGQFDLQTMVEAGAALRREVAVQDGTLEGRARRLGALSHRFGTAQAVWAEYRDALADMKPADVQTMESLSLDGLNALVTVPADLSLDPTLYAERLTEALRNRLSAPHPTATQGINHLPDGARFVVAPREGTGTVAVHLRLAGGLAEEPAILRGAAALTAQLLGDALPSAAVRADAEAIYIDWQGPKDRLRGFLERSARAVGRSSWSAQDIESARRDVLNGKRGAGEENLLAALVPALSAKRRGAEQRRASLSGITAASLAGWFQANVSDAPMVISIAGDIDADLGVRIVRRAFLRQTPRLSVKMSKTAAFEEEGAGPPFSAPGVLSLPSGILSNEDREVLRVLVALLENQRTASAGGQLRLERRHGIDYLAVDAPLGKREVVASLEALRTAQVDLDVLEAAKRRAIGQQKVRWADDRAFAAWQLQQVVLGSDWIGVRSIARWLATVEGVTVVDVQNLVEKLFNRGSFTTTVAPSKAVSGGGDR